MAGIIELHINCLISCYILYLRDCLAGWPPLLAMLVTVVTTFA